VSHRTYQIVLETFLELHEEVETSATVEALVELFTDPCYGMDGDGRRCEIRTEVNNVEFTSLHLNFPGFPGLRVSNSHKEICYWLGERNTEMLIDQVCEKAFREEGEEI